MTTQVVETVPAAETEYQYLGGSENIGSKGGHHNVKVHFADLWKYECVQRWLRKRAPTTRAEYLSKFEKFLAWTSKEINISDPDGLIAWARRQPNGIIVQDLIDAYGETQTPGTAHIVTAAVRGFLGRNGYRDLPKIDWPSTMSYAEGYRRVDIQQLLGYLSMPTHKLYVLTAKDSGLRANDILYMRYKHLKDDLEQGKEFVHLKFERERYLRRKAPGRTFIGPNTITLLRQLIKDGKVKTDPEAKIFPFSYRGVTFSLTLAKKKAGLNSEIRPSHGLRSFFETCLDKVGMDHNKKMQLEGHSQGVRGAYTSRDVEELRTLYSQAYKFLDLSEEAVVDQNVLNLTADNVELRKKIKVLEDERSEMREVVKFTKELMSHPEIRKILGKKPA